MSGAYNLLDTCNSVERMYGSKQFVPCIVTVYRVHRHGQDSYAVSFA